MDLAPVGLKAFIMLLFALALVSLAGLFEQEIRDIIGNLFALFLRPLLLINNSLQTFWREVGDFYRKQFTVRGRLNFQNVFFQFIGSILYSLFFFAFNYCEFHLLALSLIAAGIDAGHFTPPMGAGTLTALAIIAGFLFWGSIILDLSGMTNTAPWRESLSAEWRRYLLIVTLFALVLSLFITASMGLFRGKVLADESQFQMGDSQNIPLTGDLNDSNSMLQIASVDDLGIYYWVPIIANICIPILVGIGGIFASWGLVTLIKFIMLIACFLAISPLGLGLLVTNLCMNIVDRVYQLLDAVFQLLASMGHRFMGLFGWRRPGFPKTGSEGNPIDTSGEPIEGESDDQKPGSTNESGIAPEEEVIGVTRDGWNPFKS